MTSSHPLVWQQCLETKAFLNQSVPNHSPRIGIVLGSGLGQFSRRIRIQATIAYEEIPHFKPTSVVGHAGNLIFGEIGGHQVICQEGRYHYYEGHTIQETVFPIRVMKALGVETLIVANAAGGINLSYRVGDIMLIRDHINFQGTNPLIGPNEAEFGKRFPDMTYPFDPKHADRALAIATEMKLRIHEGVYISVTGPSYETPAEIRMFRMLGADAVGMSTVNEVIAANHCGMRVMGLSCIANAAAGMVSERLDHSDVSHAIEAMSEAFETLVEKWIYGYER